MFTIIAVLIFVSFCAIKIFLNPGKYILNNPIEYKQLSDKQLESYEV